MPNLRAKAREYHNGGSESTEKFKELIQYGLACVEPGFNYFRSKLSDPDSDLAHQVKIFRLARFLHSLTAKRLQFSMNNLNEFLHFKFIRQGCVHISQLRTELPLYQRAFNSVNDDVNINEFWIGVKEDIPMFFELYCILLLFQPSSGCVERVFSILTAMFTDQQELALHDYVQTQVMLRFNYRNSA